MVRFIRCLCLSVLLLGIAPMAPALAQTPAPAPATVSPEELQRLVATLEDEAARNKLVEQLKALIAAERATTPQVPERIAARFLGSLSERLSGIGETLLEAADFIAYAPKLLDWIATQLRDEPTRRWLLSVLGGVATVLIGGWIAEWLVRRAMSRLRLRLETHHIEGPLATLGYALLHALIVAVPIAVFAAVAFGLLAVVQPGRVASLIALAMINASLISRAIGLGAWAILAPHVTALRMAPLGDETATYLYVWVRRLANIGVYGYFGATVALLLGLPLPAHVFVLKLIGVVIALLLIVLVLQNRAGVAAWIAGEAAAAESARRLRQRFAEIWHVVAMTYVAIVLVIWLLRPDAGVQIVARATVVTLGLIVLAHLAVLMTRRLTTTVFSISEDLRQRFPALEARANRYLQVVNIVAAAAIYGFAALAVFQAWGLGSLDWFATPFGQRVGGSVLSIAITTAVALVLWEGANIGLERYLMRSGGTDPEALRRTARLRTLLPFIRRVLLAVLGVFVGLIALSEIGVNIAPLLAGAGVIGIAVGFGAQNLVKDLIGGVGLVLDDALAVGDVVRVGDKAGVVEAMSIRSLRLRGLDGTVHTIPFGEVQIVSNLTKEFSFAVFDIGVSYKEDVDRVMAVVKALGAELREDAQLGPLTSGDFEILGVDQFADSAVVIKARIRTLPGQQWTVMRAFNRRLKLAFDREGIEIPFPQRTVHMVVEPKAAPGPEAVKVGAAAAES